MKKAVMTVMAVLVALVWFGTQSVQSAPVLDQSFDSTGGDQSFAAVAVRPSLTQTFTANMTGYLVKVSLLMDSAATNSQPATISIVSTLSGVPTNTVLWTGNYTSLADGWFDVNITSGAPAIVSGTAYGIRLQSTESGLNSNVWLAKTTSDFYTGGKLYEDRGLGWVSVSTSGTPYPNADGGFRTYVDVVPEPTTASLMILALSLVVFVTFRRRPAS